MSAAGRKFSMLSVDIKAHRSGCRRRDGGTFHEPYSPCSSGLFVHTPPRVTAMPASDSGCEREQRVCGPDPKLLWCACQPNFTPANLITPSVLQCGPRCDNPEESATE